MTEKRHLENDLHRVRQTLDDAITNMNDGLAIFDRAGVMLFCNEQYRRLFPLTADLRVPGARLADIMEASLVRKERAGDRHINREWFKAISGDRFSRQEDLVEMADGRWLHLKTVSVEKGLLFLVSDISEQKRAEAATHAAAGEYRALFENAVAGIFRSTIDGRMLRANPALVRLNGCKTEAELVSDVNDIAKEWYVEPGRRAEFIAMMERDGRVTDFVSEVYRFKTRERIWISESAWAVRDVSGKLLCYEGTITEITDRMRAEEELKQTNLKLHSLSTTDGLTGLGNRRSFDECLAAEFDRAKKRESPLGLIIVDVDHFKRFNDAYGHVRGDQCLRFIAQVVSTIPRNYGDRACRYGGEEMAIVLPDTDQQAATQLAERLRNAVRSLSIAHTGSETGVVTISVGVSVMTPAYNFASPEELIASADDALYRAKKSGRNKVALANAA